MVVARSLEEGKIEISCSADIKFWLYNTNISRDLLYNIFRIVNKTVLYTKIFKRIVLTLVFLPQKITTDEMPFIHHK